MARQQRSTIFAQESTSPIARVALYARVSTLNNQDPEMQLCELREYAGRRGGRSSRSSPTRACPGCKESRPALNRLMSDACRRRFDAVLVWKIDRFGRSLKHLVNALAELAALGVAFISLRDNLDLSTPSGRLMFQIIGAMAEFERALIQERVRAGLRNARAKGRRLGRPRVIVDATRIASLRAQGRPGLNHGRDGNWERDRPTGACRLAQNELTEVSGPRCARPDHHRARRWSDGYIRICSGGLSLLDEGFHQSGIAFTYSNLSVIVLRVPAIQLSAWLTWKRFRTGAQAPGTAFRLVIGS